MKSGKWKMSFKYVSKEFFTFYLSLLFFICHFCWKSKSISKSTFWAQNLLFGLKKLLKNKVNFENFRAGLSKKALLHDNFRYFGYNIQKKLSKNNLAVKIDHHLKFAYKIWKFWKFSIENLKILFRVNTQTNSNWIFLSF